MNVLPAFEESLLPLGVRNRAALRNLVFHAAHLSRNEVFRMHEELALRHSRIKPYSTRVLENFDKVARRLAKRIIRPHIPCVTIFLPGPCPYRCDGCITAASLWQSLDEHIAFQDLEKTLQTLKSFGLRLIRISGEGEPTHAKAFLPLVRWARANGINVVSCTNGMKPGPRVLEEFRVNERLYLAVKLLSEDADEQNAIVKPESPKNRVRFEEHSVLGSVPDGFYATEQLAPSRAGFRITVYASNTASVKKILAGNKLNLVPTFIAPAEEAGEAAGHHELVPQAGELTYTGFLKDPNWTLFSIAINAVGEVISGMPNEAVMPRGEQLVGVADPEKTIRELYLSGSRYVSSVLNQSPVPVMV